MSELFNIPAFLSSAEIFSLSVWISESLLESEQKLSSQEDMLLNSLLFLNMSSSSPSWLHLIPIHEFLDSSSSFELFQEVVFLIGPRIKFCSRSSSNRNLK